MPSTTSALPVRELTLPFREHSTAVRVTGDLQGADRRPLVVLHGGPGCTMDYLLALADLAAQYVLPDAQVPVGIVTGIVGGPYLVWLLAAGSRRRSA